MKKILFPTLIAFCLASLFSCAVKDDQAGVTITGNTGKIYGTVALPTSTALARKSQSKQVALEVVNPVWDSIIVVLAQAVDTGWVLDSSKVDSAGFFTFDSLVAGRYFVAAHFPDGSTLQHDAIQLEQGQSQEVTLEGKPILAIEGFQTWNLNIKCENGTGDTAKRAALFGPSHPSPLVSVRYLESSYQIMGRMYTSYYVFGTMISVQFPRQTSKPDTVEIIVDASIYDRYSQNFVEFTPGQDATPIVKDTIPHRRLRITWDSNGPSCVLLDSIGIPHVSCESYTPQQTAGDIEIQNELGSILRDFVPTQLNDTIKGYLFQDSITLGGGRSASELLEAKAIADTSTDTSQFIRVDYSSLKIEKNHFDLDMLKSLPQIVVDALNADSNVNTINIGPSHNTPVYWDTVPGAFIDAKSQPYQDLWVPFESNSNYDYSKWLKQTFPHYQVPQGYVSIRKAGEYALLSFGYEGQCDNEYAYLLKQDSTKHYQLVMNWVSWTGLACD